MKLPNGLARSAVRFKPSSFAGTFVALMMSALIVTACGILLETGLRASVPPERYVRAPVVAAADQYEYVVTGSGEDREKEAVPLPDTARLDTGLAAKAAEAPGVAIAVADFTFPVRHAGEALTGQGWGSHAFTGTALTTGSAPRDGEVVLDAATARAAKADVGDTVALETASGRQDFRVALIVFGAVTGAALCQVHAGPAVVAAAFVVLATTGPATYPADSSTAPSTACAGGGARTAA